MAPRDMPLSNSDEVDATSNFFANSTYSLSVEKRNEIMKLLRDCGTDMIMPLPKIVVIGNQSAGKSSLIEAISKIKLPRSKGTTTRCPMEVALCRAKGTNGTHYTISLRYEHSSEVPVGKQLGTSKFCETQDPNEVPILIRRAQLAILNPGTDVEKFLALDEGKCEKYKTELAFSRNMVVIEITDADVDLTFIDLPGIIANTENTADEDCIDLIRNLTISYASQGECLILVTISMEDDLSNQAALKIAKDCDRKGLRTKVALTKVDRVQSGDIEYWINILKDEGVRYFITRLHPPDTNGRTQSWEDDRRDEEKCLNNQPWCRVSKSQRGTVNLVKALSNDLAGMIKARLPTLMNDIEKKLQLIQDDLNSLPQSFADNPQRNILNLCSEFNNRIKKYTIGSESHPDFFQDLYDEFERLAKDITATKPNFDIPQKIAQNETPSIIVPCQDFAPPTCPPIPFPPENDLTDELEAKQEPNSQVITLQHVRDVIKRKSLRLLPGYVPFTVLEHFISSFVSKWPELCLHSFNVTQRLLITLVDRLNEEYFGRFESSGLLHDVKVVVTEIMKRVAKKTQEQIKLICELEANRPFTFSHECFSVSKEQYMIEFAYHRNQNKSRSVSRTSHTIRDVSGNFQHISQNEVTDDVLLGHLAAKGYRLSDIKQLSRLHGPDEYETEFTVISDVLAYFDIASRRIMDNMPMILEVVFARDFGRELQNGLISDLNLIGDQGGQNCERYTRDEEHVRLRRGKLSEDKRILLKALEILHTS